MGNVIRHAFVSPITDAGDPDIVGPDEWNDEHDGITVYGTSSGTNTITATESANRTWHLFKAGAANTGAATFNGDDLLDKDGNALAAGAIQPNVWYLLVHDGSDYFVVMSGAVL